MAYDILLASAVRTTGSAQSVNYSCPKGQPIRVELDLTASSGPTTLDVRVQHSIDGGTTWKTIQAFTQLGAVATGFQSVVIAAPHSGVLRIDYTVVGTSYTFSVTMRREESAV